MTPVHTVIIGASAAGLATAACLQKKGISFIILEKSPAVGTRWRDHYDRLHLHTSKNWSALPLREFGHSVPKYPARMDMVNYLEDYARSLNIVPVFNTEVSSVRQIENGWITETNQETYSSKFVIVASGLNNEPDIPEFEGMDSFKGTLIHSSRYKNGAAFAGKKVLIIGFGNSGCEQAICLHEHGAFPSMSVRSAVNVIPRDIFGFPVLQIGKLTSFFPAGIADKINAPLIRMLVGDISKLGLKKAALGPREQIEKQKKIPLLDIGTIKLIRKGLIQIHGDVLKIDGNTVYFKNNCSDDFDVIVLATGFRHNLERFLHIDKARIEDLNRPVSKQKYFGKEGLYFCGFYISPRGMLHEIGYEARKIAKDIAGRK